MVNERDIDVDFASLVKNSLIWLHNIYLGSCSLNFISHALVRKVFNGKVGLELLVLGHHELEFFLRIDPHYILPKGQSLTLLKTSELFLTFILPFLSIKIILIFFNLIWKSSLKCKHPSNKGIRNNPNQLNLLRKPSLQNKATRCMPHVQPHLHKGITTVLQPKEKMIIWHNWVSTSPFHLGAKILRTNFC